mmetsp:Transcript_30057/g.36677  ORF Transcript_30057/g.36677 Transcript_30057/m.36677 type:complete len:604 (+) Transcript_30057:159-1970(+)|eukprot:CAMPEP_0172497304 /NCGR_PEP_ID=MMETSP1066-20121228/97947_1 /TAXON_ID=671091 /ORGANISM="Coscinodiscus wailesii, Strain CCMP2513" /LENGTH=603 /DNA_ID=CAMNT_0013269985 /DNA_START=158 /DNA_END=1969 /DNA_ORIENTATION=-
MEESPLIAERAALYSAVSKGDHESMILIYTHALKNAAMTCNDQQSQFSIGTGAASASIRDESTASMAEPHNESRSEEKLDEFFHHSPTSNHGDSHFKKPMGDRNTMALMEELDNIFQSFDEKVSCGTRNSSSSSNDAFPSQTTNTNPEQRGKNVSKGDDRVRITAKMLSNSRPPPNFVFYGHDASPDSSPLFDNRTVSLVHLACLVDAPFCMAILLAMGADISGRHSSFRRLPIHEAACSGSINCLSLLLDLSAKYTSRPPQSNSPSSSSPLVALHGALTLSSSISHNALSPFLASQHLLTLYTSLCPYIIFNLSSLHSLSDGHGNTPLHWAAFKNHPECISRLLSAGADHNSRTHHSGWTPLHDAAYSNASEAIELLLNNGADVDARARSGATPLCFAAQEDATGAVELLLRWGADADVRCFGMSERSSSFTTDPVIPSRFSGYTPLHYCAHYNATRASKLLLESGAKVDVRDLNGRMVLHVAVVRGSTSVLEELLRSGVRLESDVLSKDLVPKALVQSPKPWKCVSQKSIDNCISLLEKAQGHWTPDRHYLWGPRDRRAIRMVLLVGKRLETVGIFREVWREVLSFCARDWFETSHSKRSV